MANTYLTRTPSSAGTQTKATISVWFKRSNLSSNQCIFSTGNNNFVIKFATTDKLGLYDYNGSSIDFELTTTQVFRDTSAWYHIVLSLDSTQSTSSDRVKLYVNGSLISAFDTTGYPSQNYNFKVNGTLEHFIGRLSGLSQYFEGYMSHVAIVDGTALAPTVFGETDSTSGIWKFKAPSGVTWGNNGFHLKFENSGNLGLDSSGNSNTFAVNGNGRQALDTPSNVYATMNANNTTSNVTLTNGNTSVSLNGSYTTYGTIQITKGKFYWEQKINGSSLFASVADGNKGSMETVGLLNQNYAWAYRSDGNKQTGGSATSWGNSFTTNDIISTALDMDNGKIWWGKNGVWQESGNPATGANAAFTGLNTSSYAPNGLTPCVGQYSGDQNTSFNFGNGYFGTTAITSAGSNGNGSLFEYDVPSGYYALNTKNINTYG